MLDLNFSDIQEKWNLKWEQDRVYEVERNKEKKFYCLDMFPYPSGSGLHVGHPLGYIATDILCRYKRLQGFNVLHAMGFDSFGLPAEQFAIETGQHPNVTTSANIDTFNSQIRKMGLSIDKKREFRTSESSYYKWTQLIFIKLFNSWFDEKEQKARIIDDLISIFQEEGSKGVQRSEVRRQFTASEWNSFSEQEQSNILMDYRLAYQSESYVNWCPNLGTVLANDEVIDGVSERGGHPVTRKKMKQWMLRITAYSDRLLDGLGTLDWPNSLIEMQKNWIGKSSGVQIKFKVKDSDNSVTVFTSKPETIYGVTYICIAPDAEKTSELIGSEKKEEYDLFLENFNKQSELEVISNTKNVSGLFTGKYAIHPITNQLLPIWLGSYVLSSYGTGAIMGVPSGDDRDARFCEKYGIDSVAVYDEETRNIINSDFLNGKSGEEAKREVISYLTEKKLGEKVVNYKMRDAIFGRQRYWGEPIPIFYKNGIPCAVDESDLPIVLPEISEYLPTADGLPPLARAKDWKYRNEYEYEYTTMPGWAGSSWYFLRYMSPEDNNALVSPEECKYWNSVDLYMGGSEHATGHLLYARFWSHVLYDLGLISFEEPFYKIFNQGMIQGRSSIVYRVKDNNAFVSKELAHKYDVIKMHVSTNLVDENDKLDIEAFKLWRNDLADSKFIYDGSTFKCDFQIEKMSKSKYNVVNPDDVIEKYGADVFRLYEMFLGPLEQSKPWSLQGIEGVERFMSRVIRLFYTKYGQPIVTSEKATEDELKLLHVMLDKVSQDIEKLSFNTAITAMMIFTNDLTKNKCHKRELLEPFLIALSSFAVYTAQELWSECLGNTGYIVNTRFPSVEKQYLVNNSKIYPISINGKVRDKIKFSLDESEENIRKLVLSSSKIKKNLDGTPVKKFVYVKNKIINLVT